MARLLLRWKCDVISRAVFFSAAMFLCGPLLAVADNAGEFYRVDLAGVGSAYDADLSLMLSGHVFAYLDSGALEVYFPRTPAGINARERVLLLGVDSVDFSARASRFLLRSVLGKDVLFAFDSVSRISSSALLAYVYLPEDGTCINVSLIRSGLARVASPEIAFQFKSEFEMYEQQAREKHKGIWRQELPAAGSARLFTAP